MPRSTSNTLGRDLVSTLDTDIVNVEYLNNMLKITFAFGERVIFTEQDLITLLEFLRSNSK